MIIIDRFRIVVKGRMDASSQEYCGIVWTEEFFLEALVSLSEFNKSLLAYEKDGATVMLPPEQTPPEVALGCTILGVPAASIPADYRFVSVWSGWTGGNPLQTFQLIPIRVQRAKTSTKKQEADQDIREEVRKNPVPAKTEMYKMLFDTDSE